MRILQFKVAGQNLSKDGDFSGIVAGTKGYLYTEYNFDSEWDGCRKAAGMEVIMREIRARP